MGTKTQQQPRAWQRMLSGRRLDLIDPSPLDIEIEDIAHGLARVARWNGQTRGDHAFSVAQHSAVVLSIFRQLPGTPSLEDELACLLHDAPEYVIGDMISPFKNVLGGNYRDIEGRLQRAIHLRYGLSPSLSASLKARIKQADVISAYFEATELAGFSREEARRFFGTPKGFHAEQVDVAPLSSLSAQALFMDDFAEIEHRRMVISA